MQPLPEVEPSVHPGGFPLDGVLERHRFTPAVTIVSALVLGFIAFQGVSLVALLVILVSSSDLSGLAGMDPTSMIETYASEFLIANTIGQFLGLLGFGWLLSKLHTSRPRQMLRVRGADIGLTLLSVVGLVALIPIVQWMGTVMDGLPWPDYIREFEQIQMDLIDRVLATNLGFFFTLFTMAATPAICEELFFRGYIQRQAERLFSTWVPAIVLTGVVFGLYHLRITQAVPLSLLGIYMAYVVWRSNSLVPGILVHFLNNGFAVALGAYIAGSETVSMEELETMDVPWYVLGLAVIVFGAVVNVMHARGAALSRTSE